jgi:hypothetical protein
VLGIVGADLDLVWTVRALKQPVPLVPDFQRLAITVDDAQAVPNVLRAVESTANSAEEQVIADGSGLGS